MECALHTNEHRLRDLQGHTPDARTPLARLEVCEDNASVPININIDKQAEIIQIAEEASSLKVKHADVRLKFLCNFYCRGVITACHLRIELMIVDLLTMTLDATRLAALRWPMRVG